MVEKRMYAPVLPETPRPIVVLGAGGIVRDAHLPAYRKAGFSVAGIYNRTIERARALASRYEVPFVSDDLERTVARAPADAVFDLALMPGQFETVLSLLPEGAAVLIQKPMGDDYEQAQRILRICADRHLTAAVNCQLRFAPYVAATRALAEGGRLGTLYDLEVNVTVNTPWDLFPNVKDHPRLEIQQHSVHYIDMIRSFLGNPRTVLARTVGHPDKTVSSSRSTIIMDYGSSVRAVINTNHDHDFGPDAQQSFIKWEGTRGCIKAKMGLLMNYPDGVPDDYAYCLDEGAARGTWTRRQLEGSWFPDAFIGTMASLMRYLEGSEATLPTAVEDVINTMAVVEAAYTSHHRGGEPPPYLATR